MRDDVPIGAAEQASIDLLGRFEQSPQANLPPSRYGTAESVDLLALLQFMGWYFVSDDEQVRRQAVTRLGASESEVVGVVSRSTRTIAVSDGRYVDGQWQSYSIAAIRFTIAHEVGHVVRHNRVAEFRDVLYEHETDVVDAHENEANRFASCLLMNRRSASVAFGARFGGPVKRSHLDESDAFFLNLSTRDSRRMPVTVQSLRSADMSEVAECFSRARISRSWKGECLADAFGVTPRAMAIRLLKLKLVLE